MMLRVFFAWFLSAVAVLGVDGTGLPSTLQRRPGWADIPVDLAPPPSPDAVAVGNVSLTVTGPSVDVWGAVDTYHRCGNYSASVPDIPARAYVDTNRLTHMIVGSTAYNHMNGPSILNVTRECTPAWNMTGDPDPSHFAGDEFLDSPIVFDNGTVSGDWLSLAARM